jgi:3-dehydroquinate synthetase
MHGSEAWGAAEAVSLIARSLEIKGAVVDEDERESGRRETLNFGHTVAHAIELLTAYAVPHGDAVAIGMVAEAVVGERLGVTAPGTAARLRNALGAVGLPTRLPAAADPGAVVAAAHGDKKARRGAMRVSLLECIGRAARSQEGGWAFAVDDTTLRAALDESLVEGLHGASP